MFKYFASSFGLGRMTRIVSLVSGIGLLASAISSNANQLTTAPGFGPWQVGSGGEFTVTPDAQLAAQLGTYSPFNLNQGGFSGSFQTFCIERLENIHDNTTYDVTVTNTTLFSYDPLSAGVAYLYWQFATGQLTDLGGTPYVKPQAYNLQHALWYLMNPTMYGGQQDNLYVLKAAAALGGLPAAMAPAGANNFGVKVLNLWTPNQPHVAGYSWQDMLIYTVPEPSVFALLSVAGILAFRRRK